MDGMKELGMVRLGRRHLYRCGDDQVKKVRAEHGHRGTCNCVEDAVSSGLQGRNKGRDMAFGQRGSMAG
eukprot:361365-Chlamydomonas_euryale.AAC.10